MARYRKINGRYYAYFYSRDREPNEKSWPLDIQRQTQRAARRELRKLEEAYDNREFDPWNGGWLRESVEVSEAMERFLDQKQGKVTERTLDTYEGILNRLLRMLSTEMSLRNLESEKIERFVYDYTIRKDEISNATQKKRYSHVKAWLRWCTDQGLLDNNPLDAVNEPDEVEKEPEHLRPEELDKLIKALDAHVENTEDAVGRSPELQWLRDMILVGVTTGLRRGALLNLHWDDIDFDRKLLHVRHRDGFQTKGKKEQTIPLRGRGLSVLRERFNRRGEPAEGIVFTDQEGDPIRPNRVSRRFSDMVEAAGLDSDLCFHSLRHTFGTWLTSEGAPIKFVQELMGHSTIAVTQRYAHVGSDPLADTMDRVFGKTDES
jgi:site-specific recombinase XerD